MITVFPLQDLKPLGFWLYVLAHAEPIPSSSLPEKLRDMVRDLHKNTPKGKKGGLLDIWACRFAASKKDPGNTWYLAGPASPLVNGFVMIDGPDDATVFAEEAIRREHCTEPTAQVAAIAAGVLELVACHGHIEIEGRK